MKVRELQDQLRKLDPELDVVCYSEDEGLSAGGRSISLFDIAAVNATEAEIIRLDDETPWPKFQRGSALRQYAFVEITSDH